jgi:hypothetical protein
MRAAISEALQAYLRQRGSTMLTITLKAVRCCGSTLYEVSVDSQAPKHPDRYESCVQDGLCLYYSPQLGRTSDLLELDYVQTVFRRKPVLAGPEDLVARLIAGHM